MQDLINAAINDWKNCDIWNPKKINSYLDLHENTFLTFGLFVRGLRVKPVPSEMLLTDFHHTLDGIRGIISLNIAILRKKIP